ncbi:MAG: hypothetical protein LBT40_05155 [Deltaproteobacteria bacterium]|nr:hypothetical protein [Deltaproteobacteria bacterium]
MHVGWLPPDVPERAKKIACAARRQGVPGIAGDASLSAHHEPLAGTPPASSAASRRRGSSASPSEST